MSRPALCLAAENDQFDAARLLLYSKADVLGRDSKTQKFAYQLARDSELKAFLKVHTVISAIERFDLVKRNDKDEPSKEWIRRAALDWVNQDQKAVKECVASSEGIRALDSYFNDMKTQLACTTLEDGKIVHLFLTHLEYSLSMGRDITNHKILSSTPPSKAAST